MPKEVIRRRAEENEYLHRDFHGALSVGIDYLEDEYGPEAVRDYIRQFTRRFYAPLIKRVKREGIVPLKEHFEEVYRIEGAEAKIELTDDALSIRVAACPAVAHMRAHGYPVARLWRETTRTHNEALVEGTPFDAELLEYDDETGASVQRFVRQRTSTT